MNFWWSQIIFLLLNVQRYNSSVESAGHFSSFFNLASVEDFVYLVLILVFQVFLEVRVKAIWFIHCSLIQDFQPIGSSHEKALTVISYFVYVMWILVKCNSVSTDHKVLQLKFKNHLMVDGEPNFVEVIHNEENLQMGIKFVNENLVLLECNWL